ncbi:biotin-dependent carboxyltransferase family protein [Occultella gossypii]|uniref:Biotin-dependent carboxyltransferase family protein n=1 Tax=Occultella gossypii TaxID=2800820 RepID=A0ABS7S674_9MICO|nr:biotin-dependent carboxyltransferase family protein [Occultella gossypii]MBZ2195859.1 biotin-dependent carboxyltransferase family protein [Occultella gossypii]
MSDRILTVLAVGGGLTLIEDLGRPGFAALGVSPSGAADRGALIAANRLLGNDDGAAALEVTMGGLTVRAESDLLLALTGASAPATVDGAAVPSHQVLAVAAGSVVRLGIPRWGLRTYLAVVGGLAVPEVLGSRSTDVLSGLGPEPLRSGDVLPVGWARSALATIDAGQAPPTGPAFMLDAMPGPRRDWFTQDAWRTLFAGRYRVTDVGDRVGVRLRGAPLSRARDDELPSEPVVAGAVQVPPDGQPLIFGPDHPVTGGYPVIAVLTESARDAAGQLRPGQDVRFRHHVSPVARTDV